MLVLYILYICIVYSLWAIEFGKKSTLQKSMSSSLAGSIHQTHSKWWSFKVESSKIFPWSAKNDDEIK